MADTTIDDTLAEAGLDPVAQPAELFPDAAVATHAFDQLLVLDGENQPVSVRDLLGERQYWREHQAVELDALLEALDKRLAPKAFLIQRIFNAYSTLKGAIAGEYFATCAGCGGQIWPGEVQVPFSDVDMHARCWVESDPAWADREVKAGDQVKVDPESLEIEEGEEPRDYVIAFETTNLFSAEQIEERVNRARHVLVQAGRV